MSPAEGTDTEGHDYSPPGFCPASPAAAGQALEWGAGLGGAHTHGYLEPGRR